MFCRVLLFGLACCLVSTTALAEKPHSLVGERVADFSLDNCYGKTLSLSEFADQKFVAIVFLGTECPLAKLYGPRLSDLQSKFEDDGVTVIGINSNKQDSITELTAYAHRYEINFPLLKDVGNRVADAIGAQRTPEVFLLDEDRVVRYHGRIDDQYGVGYSRERTVQSDLERAIQELLDGDTVSVSETEAVGCHIGRIKNAEPIGDITFTKHIAPIFNARCVNCHREGEIAPFTLTGFDDVLGWEDTILEVIDDNRMPPWSADPSHGEFANDARLTENEKSLIATWVDNGMPKGDPADLPEPPKFVEGWQIPEPDQVLQMRENPFTVPAEGVVDYKHFIVDPKWDEDKFIYAAEARPQNRSIVHHILVYVIQPGERPRARGQVLVGYAPGAVPMNFGDGIAIRVKGGSKLLFEMHYTPNGSEQTDLSYAGVCFMDKKDVRKELQGRAVANHQFRIPPGDANHKVVAKYRSPSDELLLSMTPHMHLRGKAFRYDAQYPDGKSETLLNVPAYDFNWQLEYILAKPKLLPRGTQVLCSAVFDNSEQNLSNPDPTRTVTWGDQSFDEMMIGFFNTVAPDKKAVSTKQPHRDPSGTWKFERKRNGRMITETLALSLSENKLSGHLRTSHRPIEIENPTIDGNRVTFQLTSPEFPGVLFQFSAKITKDELIGEIKMSTNANEKAKTIPWKAFRE